MTDSFQALERLPVVDQQRFNDFGRGPQVLPAFSLVHQAFESIVDCQPSSVAVEHDGHIITYGELEKLANVLANRLIATGLRPQRRVCLVLQRSIHMVVAILAVLKCGCQYVPLDGGVVPDNMLTHIFKDTSAPYVLCLEKFRHRVQKFTGTKNTVFVLDGQTDDENDSILAPRPAVDLNYSDGAYIIYTSGMLRSAFVIYLLISLIFVIVI
jgi:non-ribosomal peptide synthetase component F